MSEVAPRYNYFSVQHHKQVQIILRSLLPTYLRKSSEHPILQQHQKCIGHTLQMDASCIPSGCYLNIITRRHIRQWDQSEVSPRFTSSEGRIEAGKESSDHSNLFAIAGGSHVVFHDANRNCNKNHTLDRLKVLMHAYSPGLLTLSDAHLGSGAPA